MPLRSLLLAASVLLLLAHAPFLVGSPRVPGPEPEPGEEPDPWEWALVGGELNFGVYHPAWPALSLALLRLDRVRHLWGLMGSHLQRLVARPRDGDPEGRWMLLVRRLLRRQRLRRRWSSLGTFLASVRSRLRLPDSAS